MRGQVWEGVEHEKREMATKEERWRKGGAGREGSGARDGKRGGKAMGEELRWGRVSWGCRTKS